MKVEERWRQFGYDHALWDLVRYYRSLHAISRRSATEWLEHLTESGAVTLTEGMRFAVPGEWAEHIADYVVACGKDAERAFDLLRTEAEALSCCENLGITVKKTRTQNKDHYQASQALVGTVTELAKRVCQKCGVTVEPNPQQRAVWCSERALHVSARNLDGAVPGLADPVVIWEIKEYWGKTKGGSKMSDALYECHLVGRELRDFEAKSGADVRHVVFVDGHEQWACRRSDLVRFIDLFHQGIVDMLIVGREVETQWAPYLQTVLNERLVKKGGKHKRTR